MSGKLKNWKKYFKCRCLCQDEKSKEEFVPSGTDLDIREADDEDDKYINRVKSINPCIRLNGSRHRTQKYELMKKEQSQLVIRRGDVFKLQLTMKAPFDRNKDIVTFIFKCQDKKVPSYNQGTLVTVKLMEECESIHTWSATVDEAVDDTVTVNIRTAPNCIIGVWNVEVETENLHTHTFKWDKSIYALFNPWCENDEVYMESDEWREETVLTSDGMIWRGSASNAAVWKYAQFEKDILDIALYLITNTGGISGHLRSDPVNVSRALSAAVNVNDDGGVVWGKWDGDYSDGKEPTYWTGSLDLLQQFYKNKEPVKYGQCWVFAGILTTVCRAIGLPSRVVTNFSSAHDSNGSITIDNIVDENGKIVEEHDSIWNFHVWSEAWMKRSDLGEGYDGWQAIDATPQERSYNMFRCGPASVAACKQGDIKKPYDVPFLYSEVNADIVYWQQEKKSGKLKLLSKQTASIGKDISTKAPGAFSRLDLTDTYKYTEQSKEERAVYLKAMRQISNDYGHSYFNESFDDIIFKFEYFDNIVIGQNFKVSLNMGNQNPDVDHEISAVLRVDILRYTGKVLDTIKSHSETVSVSKNSTNKIELDVYYSDYKDIIEDNCIFLISCLAEVIGTGYQYFDRDDFRIKNPSIEIDINNRIAKGKETIAKVKVTNPLPKALKKGKFLIEAPGLGRQISINVNEKIQPGDTIVKEFKFIPDEPGRQTVAAKFMSKELHDVNGFCHFLVNE